MTFSMLNTKSCYFFIVVERIYASIHNQLSCEEPCVCSEQCVSVWKVACSVSICMVGAPYMVFGFAHVYNGQSEQRLCGCVNHHQQFIVFIVSILIFRSC